MQDEVNEKVVSLAIKTSKLTAEVLQKAMKALLAKGKGQLTKAPHGKITMRQLMKPGEKVSNIEITGQNIKAFDPIARKNGLDYNVKKIENGKPPTYLVSFRGKDIDVMTEAFREFTAKKLGRDKKPPICSLSISLTKSDRRCGSLRELTFPARCFLLQTAFPLPLQARFRALPLWICLSVLRGLSLSGLWCTSKARTQRNIEKVSNTVLPVGATPKI